MNEEVDEFINKNSKDYGKVKDILTELTKNDYKEKQQSIYKEMIKMFSSEAMFKAINYFLEHSMYSKI